MKNYTVTFKLQGQSGTHTVDVSAKSKMEAGRIVNAKHNYKAYGISVKGPF